MFTNRRGGVFVSSELRKLNSTTTLVLPEITTISDFGSDITESIEVSRTEALFVLYEEYNKWLGEYAEPFDKFAFWWDMILSDFNDVDKYLVEYKKLFHNISELKDINSDYLTQEQKEVLSQFFGEGFLSKCENARLWIDNSSDVDATNKKTFLT